MTGVTLAVLAGGEGSRMGRPKGLLRVHGRPVLEYLLDRFQWKGPTLLVTAPGREHPPAWELFSREVQDPVAGLGPLRGILTALEAAETPLVVMASVDMPGVGRAQLDWLLSRIRERPRAPGVMCSRLNNARPRIEPFPAVFRAKAAGPLAQILRDGTRAVHMFAHAAGSMLVDAPAEWPASVWTNLNTPDDLKDARLE